MTCMIWLYIVTYHKNAHGSAWDEVFGEVSGTKYWPMTLAMILGVCEGGGMLASE